MVRRRNYCHNVVPIKIGKGVKGKNIVLMGNPNVGKSVLFSRLTGANVVSSNYPGTTVDVCQGKMNFRGRLLNIIDAPGTYSLSPTNKAEEVAAKILEDADVVVNVLDATNLERNLYQTIELIEKKVPLVVVLNMWDETKHKGIDIDISALSEELGVPIVTTVALTGEGVKDLVETLPHATKGPAQELQTENEMWARVGQIINRVQRVRHRHHTFLDRLEEATIIPYTGIPIAIIILLASFFLVRFIGEGLIGYVFEPLFELYRPFVMTISNYLGGGGLLHDIVVGKLISGEIDYVESLGVITTGIYVPVAMVFPYIFSFYFFLSILEDSGYLPRLATLADNVFHRLGIHGHAIVSVFLGIGCNVPGVLATRVLETRRQRFIAATLLSISVPCMAQIAMIFGVLGPYGSGYLLLVFVILLSVYTGVGLLLNRVMKGESPEIFLEIPPYRIPSFMTVVKKTYMRLKAFVFEAIPFLMGGVFLVNLLYSLGVIDFLIPFFLPVVEGVLGLPGDATLALLMGFLRKDLAIGVLLALDMNPLQLVIAVVVLTIYFPCVATFAVLFKELGWKDMAKASAIMLSTALLVGGTLRLIFQWVM